MTPVRRDWALLLLCTLIVVMAAFVALALLVKAKPLLAIDLQITSTLQSISLPYFTLIMRAISWPGYSPQSLFIVGLVSLLLYGLGRHWEGVMALIAAVSVTTIGMLVKELIQRPRPLSSQVRVFASLNGYGFPSGHVMFYVVFGGFIGFLIFRSLNPSSIRSLVPICFGSLLLLIGLSRIYLGVHWPSDVLGSYMLGGLTLAAVMQVYFWGKRRSFNHKPATTESGPA